MSPAARHSGSDGPGEFALIDSFLAPFGVSRNGRRGPAASGVLCGPGDDCAQLAPSRGMRLVATTDAALDGVHFDLRRSSAEDAGWKALAMNLSDLAAAGARPRWFLCALGVPIVGMPQNALAAVARGFGRGMARLAKESGCALVGGNLTRAKQWSLTITALGEARRPLSRAGARPGDALVLVGELGAAALGLSWLQDGPSHGAAKRNRLVAYAESLPAAGRAAVRAQLRPVPQVEAGLVAAALASAAIDISDGLLQDLGHLCARSGCAAELACERLPRSPLVRAHEARAARRGDHPYALSLAGGEDYALLLAVPAARAPTLLRRLAGRSCAGRSSAGSRGGARRRERRSRCSMMGARCRCPRGWATITWRALDRSRRGRCAARLTDEAIGARVHLVQA